MTSNEIEKLKNNLDECQKLKDEYLSGWQRSRADFLNYKKEEMKRMGEILKYANEELILKILPFLDNLNIAEKKLSPKLKDNEYVKGFLQIKKQFQDFLKNEGVEEMKTLNERFDPNFHEVIEETESENKETGIIIEEIQKGYKIKGRLLRPAKVKVTK